MSSSGNTYRSFPTCGLYGCDAVVRLAISATRMSLMQNRPNKLAVFRERAGWSRAQAAALVGCGHQNAIARYERGERLPNLQHAITLATAYQVPLEGLFPAHVAYAQDAIARHEAVRAAAHLPPVTPCVLALYLGTRKVGVAVLEVPTRRLVAAQVRNLEVTTVSGGMEECRRQLVIRLFQTWQPQVLVLEHTDYPGSRRSRAIPQSTKEITRLAQQRQMTVSAYTLADLHNTLIPDGIVRTKAMLCRILVHQYPKLGRYLPKLRRGIGDSEPYYFRLFMAVALSLTWLRTEGKKQW